MPGKTRCTAAAVGECFSRQLHSLAKLTDHCKEGLDHAIIAGDGCTASCISGRSLFTSSPSYTGWMLWSHPSCQQTLAGLI
jgi:hypothetical protein